VGFKIKYNKRDLVSPLDGTSKRPTYWDIFLDTNKDLFYQFLNIENYLFS
jgi:hypothetical protein